MKLIRVDQAITACENHLANTNSGQTEVESYLTQYLLVLICASFEEEIERIFLRRAERTNDPHLKSFFKHSVDKLGRSIKSSELSGLLGKFGSDYKEAFSKKISGTVEETYYNSIINNRHGFAHSTGYAMTFRDLKNYYEKGHIILDALNEALKNTN